MQECWHAEWDQDPINLGEKAGGNLRERCGFGEENLAVEGGEERDIGMKLFSGILEGFVV